MEMSSYDGRQYSANVRQVYVCRVCGEQKSRRSEALYHVWMMHGEAEQAASRKDRKTVK